MTAKLFFPPLFMILIVLFQFYIALSKTCPGADDLSLPRIFQSKRYSAGWIQLCNTRKLNQKGLPFCFFVDYIQKGVLVPCYNFSFLLCNVWLPGCLWAPLPQVVHSRLRGLNQTGWAAWCRKGQHNASCLPHAAPRADMMLAGERRKREGKEQGAKWCFTV